MKDKQAFLEEIVRLIEAENLRLTDYPLVDEFCPILSGWLAQPSFGGNGRLIEECGQWKLWTDGPFST